MGDLVLAGTLLLNIACMPSDITEAEARALVLHAAATVSPHHLAADAAPGEGEKDEWSFRVRSTDPTESTSTLVGWYSVNKRSAALRDPIAEQSWSIPQIQAEQTKLRIAHCLT